VPEPSGLQRIWSKFVSAPILEKFFSRCMLLPLGSGPLLWDGCPLSSGLPLDAIPLSLTIEIVTENFKVFDKGKDGVLDGQ
jgi:hypothetical protein